jgi:hypothetical protein
LGGGYALTASIIKARPAISNQIFACLNQVFGQIKWESGHSSGFKL